MENFESAQTRSTRDRHCQPGRHPMNMVIRPAIHRKVLALVAKVDAALLEAAETLPVEAPHGGYRFPKGHTFGKGHGKIGPTVPGEPKGKRRYITTRTTKAMRGECRDCDTIMVGVGYSRCPECRKIRAIKRATAGYH